MTTSRSPSLFEISNVLEEPVKRTKDSSRTFSILSKLLRRTPDTSLPAVSRYLDRTSQVTTRLTPEPRLAIKR